MHLHCEYHRVCRGSVVVVWVVSSVGNVTVDVNVTMYVCILWSGVVLM